MAQSQYEFGGDSLLVRNNSFLAQNQTPTEQSPFFDGGAGQTEASGSSLNNDAQVAEPQVNLSDVEFQAPMQNVFLNTLFGGVTGFFLGLAYGISQTDLGSKDSSFSDLNSPVSHATLNGAIIGGIIGTMLSFSNFTLDDSTNGGNFWELFLAVGNHPPIPNTEQGISQRGFSLAFRAEF